MDRKHLVFMKQALALAKQAEGQTSPNPPVGAVVVKNGRIVGKGFHRKAGEPHAEVEALRDAGTQAQGATLYVTLEPCNHHGRTPPCTEAIIAAGIKQVYYAIEDPNPHVAGHGRFRLKEAGLEVHAGLLASEAGQMIRFFSHYVRTSMPYTVASCVATWDGAHLALVQGTADLRDKAVLERHAQLQQTVDALLVHEDMATALAHQWNSLNFTRRSSDKRRPVLCLLPNEGDDPGSDIEFRNVEGWDRVWRVHSAPESTLSHAPYIENNTILPAPLGADEDLKALLAELGRRHITSVWLDGRPEMVTQLAAQGLIQEIWALVPSAAELAIFDPGRSKRLALTYHTRAYPFEWQKIERIGSTLLMRGINTTI